MSDLRRRPADFRAEARARIAEQLRSTSTPADRAEQDQWEAAHHESDRVLKEIVGGSEEITRPPSVGSVAWILARRAACERRIVRWCPHIDNPPPGTPLFMLLMAGYAGCADCLVQPGVVVLEDDGRCDVCDTPTKYFYPIRSADGAFMTEVNVCKSCKDFAWKA